MLSPMSLMPGAFMIVAPGGGTFPAYAVASSATFVPSAAAAGLAGNESFSGLLPALPPVFANPGASQPPANLPPAAASTAAASGGFVGTTPSGGGGGMSSGSNRHVPPLPIGSVQGSTGSGAGSSNSNSAAIGNLLHSGRRTVLSARRDAPKGTIGGGGIIGAGRGGRSGAMSAASMRKDLLPPLTTRR